jgi:Recombinase zinc beta ribbon domain
MATTGLGLRRRKDQLCERLLLLRPKPAFLLGVQDVEAPAPELTRQVQNLLAGLCRCASCSYAMRSEPARGDYRCRTTSVNGRCPQPTTISQKGLEQYVLEAFLERQTRATSRTTSRLIR